MTITAPDKRVRDKLSLAQLAQITASEMHGDDVEFSGLSIDSRSLDNGELFVALRGPNFDGHHFIDDARQHGAVALLVEYPVDSPLPQVIVADTHTALGVLAAAWRMRYSIPLIAVTGSNGKTTVKEMLASILVSDLAHQRREQGQHEVLATHGNLNNDIGVPLTLMRLNHKHHYAVIEMGANHHGEISYLTRLASPTVALVNNAGPAHLEGFGDVKGVAGAKGEIFAGLQAEGVAVFNADDEHADVWRGLCVGKTCKTFGITTMADVTASDLQPNDGVGYHFRLHASRDLLTGSRVNSGVDSGMDSIMVTLPLPGRHNVMNALAAATAALAVGVTLQTVRDGLQTLDDISGRLQVRQGGNGVTVIDDTYNANPASLQVALDLLNDGADSEKILVLGEMGELGDLAPNLHRQMGEQARVAGIDQLFSTGELAQYTVAAFGVKANHFATQEALITALIAALLTAHADKRAVTVLVKGSRSMQMEHVVSALLTADLAAGGGSSKDVVYARIVEAGG